MSWIKDRLKLFTEDGETDINRRSGRTTANLLQAISKAMSKPETAVIIKDHFHGTDPRRFIYMTSMLRELLEKLKFEGFYFNRKEGAITYSLDPDFIKVVNKSPYLVEIK